MPDNVNTDKGSWQTSISKKGEFLRKDTQFRNTIKKGTEFEPEAGRYHLYVAYACPWAHRTLITRSLKGLDDVISVSVVHWILAEGGWKFEPEPTGSTVDHVNGFDRIAQIYNLEDKEMKAHFTVPVLFDKKTKRIVNNESSEIIRILTTEFNEFCKTDEQRAINLYPEELREKIDEVNAWVYPKINNGVYRAGFATSQEAYEAGVKDVFDGLDRAEEILSKSKYLIGDTITEADVRLLTTLLRFDMVYQYHFKCNIRRLVDYPNTWAYTRALYQDLPGVRETTNFDHIKKHYFMSHKSINPNSVVPLGPNLDFDEPHGRN